MSNYGAETRQFWQATYPYISLKKYVFVIQLNVSIVFINLRFYLFYPGKYIMMVFLQNRHINRIYVLPSSISIFSVWEEYNYKISVSKFDEGVSFFSYTFTHLRRFLFEEKHLRKRFPKWDLLERCHDVESVTKIQGRKNEKMFALNVT